MRIHKRKRKVRGKSVISGAYNIDFRDHRNLLRENLPGYTSRKATENLAKKVAKLVTLRAAGECPDRTFVKSLEDLPQRALKKLVAWEILEPDVVIQHSPLQELVARFLRDLEGKQEKGRVKPKRVEVVRTRLKKILKGCKFTTTQGIRGKEVDEFLAKKRAKGEWSARTSNCYLQIIGQFTKWLVRIHALQTDPLSMVTPVSITEENITKKRHALTLAEQKKLLDSTKKGGRAFGMTGQERYLIYLLALETGLRAGEIVTLTAGSFDLGRKSPRLSLRAADTKNKKSAVLPLRPGLTKLLRRHLKDRMPAASAFPRMPPTYDTADMLRRDIKVAKIDNPTANGEIIDFHSLRHTYCTNIANSGLPINTARALMRHASITTTEKYMHSDEKTVALAVQALPQLAG